MLYILMGIVSLVPDGLPLGTRTVPWLAMGLADWRAFQSILLLAIAMRWHSVVWGLCLATQRLTEEAYPIPKRILGESRAPWIRVGRTAQ